MDKIKELVKLYSKMTGENVPKVSTNNKDHKSGPQTNIKGKYYK